jgi:hypothetical protein
MLVALLPITTLEALVYYKSLSRSEVDPKNWTVE